MSGVSIEEVRRVADLANVELTVEEEQKMQNDLNAILGHFAELNQLDTSNVEPMSQVSDILGDASNALRSDTVVPSIDRNALMDSAPETDGRFFKVPKVLFNK